MTVRKSVSNRPITSGGDDLPPYPQASAKEEVVTAPLVEAEPEVTPLQGEQEEKLIKSAPEVVTPEIEMSHGEAVKLALEVPLPEGIKAASEVPEPQAIQPKPEIVAAQPETIHTNQPDVPHIPEIRKQPEMSNVSVKTASDLALDLVLNEIVLQARLTTNATGAMLALARQGQLVCRATTGATAADVSLCLSVQSGICAISFESNSPRRSDDIGSDSQPDIAAYRRGGVRSILVVPVQGEREQPLGILQILSPRANAFCDRDVLTLQALARRISANIELAHNTTVVIPIRKALAAAAPTQVQGSAGPKTSLAFEGVNRGLKSVAKRLAGRDWMPVLTKTTLALILAVGCLGGHAAWIQEKDQAPSAEEKDKNSQSVETISVSLAPDPSGPTQPEADTVAAPEVPNSAQVLPTTDPRSWPRREKAQPAMTSSITIQRVPVHRGAKSGVEANVMALPSGKISPDRKSASSENSPAVVASKNSAPNAQPAEEAKTDKQSGPEVLPTEAAMELLTDRVEPEYPNSARQQRIQGTVLLDVVVDAQGKVDGLGQVSGESQLMIAAAEAVRQWRFKPLVKNGEAKKFETRVSINFTLPSGPK